MQVMQLDSDNVQIPHEFMAEKEENFTRSPETGNIFISDSMNFQKCVLD